MGTLIRFFLSKGLIFCAIVALVLLAGCAPPKSPDIMPVPKDHFVIRPIWHSMDRVPRDLQGRLAPAILVDPNGYYERKILSILGAEGPGQYDPKSIPNWGDQLMAWGDQADPYVWFQPGGYPELVPGPWGEIIWAPDGRELFRRWFEEADLILVEET